MTPDFATIRALSGASVINGLAPGVYRGESARLTGGGRHFAGMSYSYKYGMMSAPAGLVEAIALAAVEMVKHESKAFQIEERRRRARAGGKTLRPGKETPLWNELRSQLRAPLMIYGNQAKLGRLLGLPRQRVNAFITGGGEMPDAERTLQLLAWLMAIHQGRPPS